MSHYMKMEDEDSMGLVDHVETTMELTTSPACLGVSESYCGSPLQSEPQSPESHDNVLSPGGRAYKKKPMYNRNTVKMEDYIHKEAENITAKEYRVLIPTMYQWWKHPSKAVSRTKVKGLWEKSEQPHDWPSKVKFRDPNNQPKFTLDDSKAVFVYLKEKILKMDRFRYLQKIKEEPRSPTPPVFQGPLQSPRMPSFGMNPGHDMSSSTVAIPSDSAGIQEQMPDHNAATLPVPVAEQSTRGNIPVLSEFYQSDTEVAFRSGVRLVENQSLPSPIPSSVMNHYDNRIQEDAQVISYETIQEENGSTITDLTVLHTYNGPDQSTSQVITVMGEETSVQPVNPQTTDALLAAETALSNAEEDMCTKFAEGIQNSLFPVVKDFCQTFENNKVIMDKVSQVVNDTFKPLFNDAHTSKVGCAELSKLGGRLQEMMKRHTFLSGCTSSDVILEDLDKLQVDFKQQEWVISQDVPQAQSEVLIMTAQEDIQPVLDVYIPTINDLKARAKQKELELEEPMSMDISEWNLYDKVITEKLSSDQDLMVVMCKDQEDQEVSTEEALCHNADTLGVTMKEDHDEADSDPNHQGVDLVKLMDDLDFLNSAGSAIMENLGIESRPIKEEPASPQQTEQFPVHVDTEQVSSLHQMAAPQNPRQDFRPQPLTWQVENQQLATQVQATQIQQPMLTQPTQTQQYAPVQQPTPIQLTQTQPTQIQLAQTHPTQIQRQNSAGHREDEAMAAFLLSASQYFGGSLTMEGAPPPSNNTEPPLDDILSLQDEYMSEEAHSSQPLVDIGAPGTTFVAIPEDSIPPELKFIPLKAEQPSPGTIPDNVLAKLQTSDCAPIPTVVLEAAEREDLKPPSKRAKYGKGGRCPGSRGGANSGKGKGHHRM